MNNHLPITIILCFLLAYYFSYRYKKGIENFVDSSLNWQNDPPKFSRCKKYVFPQIEQNVTNKLHRVEDDSWDVWFPCGYTDIEGQLQKHDHFRGKEQGGIVLGISGADSFAAKDQVWNSLRLMYGREKASTFMPLSWVTYDKADMDNFREYSRDNPGEMFIMKKNIQRQQGLLIIKDAAEAENAFDKEFVVVQKILQDPYVLDGRKVNLRVYILVVCTGSTKKLYIYNDGFVYYSKELYTDGTERDQIITSGYIDRRVYDRNPLTSKQFSAYIDQKHGIGTSRRFWNLVQSKLAGILPALSDKFCNAPDSNVTFAQTFGADIQPNSDLTNVHILEFNKGADLSVKDERDGKLKQNMVDDMFRVLNLRNNGENHSYSLIWTN